MARRILPVALALLLLAAPATTALAQGPMVATTDVVILHPSGGNMMGPGGMAWVTPDMDHTVVTVLAWGLEPGSGHSSHVHTGSCQNEGGIVYDLANLVANDMGIATATTIVPSEMTMMGTGPQYVNVHAGILGTSPAAAPGITCGNLGAMEPMMMPMDPMMDPMMSAPGM